MCHVVASFRAALCVVSSFLSGLFFFSSRRRHTRFKCDWSSDVCSSDLTTVWLPQVPATDPDVRVRQINCDDNKTITVERLPLQPYEYRGYRGYRCCFPQVHTLASRQL